MANETGQVLLLLSLIAIGREIGMEVQVRDGSSYVFPETFFRWIPFETNV